MKLLRYGPRGQEKPGMMDADGTIRDLSAYVDDINGASISVDGLAKLGAIDPASLPAVDTKWICQVWRRARRVPPPLGLPADAS